MVVIVRKKTSVKGKLSLAITPAIEPLTVLARAGIFSTVVFTTTHPDGLLLGISAQPDRFAKNGERKSL